MEQVSGEHSTLGNIEGNVKTLLCVLIFFFTSTQCFYFYSNYKQTAKLTQYSPTPDPFSFLNQSVINLTSTDFQILITSYPTQPCCSSRWPGFNSKAISSMELFPVLLFKGATVGHWHAVTSLRRGGLVDMPAPGCLGETEPWKHMPVGTFTHNSVLRVTKAETVNLFFVFNLP